MIDPINADQNEDVKEAVEKMNQTALDNVLLFQYKSEFHSLLLENLDVLHT